jgi:hypothetical protein
VEVKVSLLELLGALALLVVIINLGLLMVVNASESAEILSSWSYVTSGTAETVSITFVIRDITVNYYADVKELPWFVKVYTALMPNSCTQMQQTIMDIPSYMLFVKLHGIFASASPLTIKLSGGY